MSDGLRPPADRSADLATDPSVHLAGNHTELGGRRDRTLPLLRIGLLLAAYVGAGAGGGYAWRAWWTPPDGVVFSGQWFPDPFEASIGDRFSAEATYMLVCAGIGLVLGLLTAIVLDRAELAGLVVAVVGAALVAYLVLSVGQSLSPPDPTVAAATAPDGTRLPGALKLDLAGTDRAEPDRGPLDRNQLRGDWPVLLAAPIGSISTLGLVYLGTTRRVRRVRSRSRNTAESGHL